MRMAASTAAGRMLDEQVGTSATSGLATCEHQGSAGSPATSR